MQAQASLLYVTTPSDRSFFLYRLGFALGWCALGIAKGSVLPSLARSSLWASRLSAFCLFFLVVSEFFLIFLYVFSPSTVDF